MNIKVFKCLLLILLLSFISLATIIVDPSRFVIVADPGEKITDSINIVNAGTEPMNLTAVLYDWDLNEMGQLNEVAPHTLFDSLGDTIKFSPKQFTLNPGQTQIVRFTVQAPIDGIEHKGIVFFEENHALDNNQSSATVTTKIGATIYISPTDATLNFQFIDIGITLINNETNFIVHALNSGTAHIRFNVCYKLQSKSGILLKEGTYQEQVLLPGKTTKLLYPIMELEKGEYRLTLEFSFTGFSETLEHFLAFTLLGEGA